MIIWKQGIWVADLPFSAKEELKAAGFVFHGSPGDCRRRDCPACAAAVFKHWWTNSAKVVRKMDGALLDSGAERILQEHDQVVEASHASAADIEIPAPPGLNYYPFQKAGIAYIRDAPWPRRVLLSDEMGLGKTCQAIGYMNLEGIGTAVVVCPANLRINWLRELERWLVEPRNIHVVDSNDLPKPDAEIVIINYDRLINPEMHEALMGWVWDLLICDESHAVKTPDAKRTVAVLGRPANKKKQQEALEGLIHRARCFLPLTGTPLLNRPIELWTLVHALDPETFNDRMQFGKRYCAGHKRKIGWNKKTQQPLMAWDFHGASNLEELQDKLRGRCMVRRLKADVLPELPPKRREIIVLDPKTARKELAEQLGLWNKVHGHTFAKLQTELQLAAQDVDDKDAYAAVVARLDAHLEIAFEEMSETRKLVAVAKIPAVIDHLHTLLDVYEIPKVVCWVHHHEVVDELMEHFGKLAVNIDGRVTPKDRQIAVDVFQKDREILLMVGGIRAAGEGITLTAASHEVFAETDWTPARNVQAEDRCHRIGQQNSVLIQYLVFDRSLDAMIAKMQIYKQAIADRVLN